MRNRAVGVAAKPNQFQLVAALGTILLLCAAAAAGGPFGAVAPVQLRPVTLRDPEQPDREPGFHLAFSHDGQRLAAVAVDGTLTIWDVPAARWLTSFSVDNGDRLSGKVEFVLGGRLLATSHRDRSIRLLTVDQIATDSVLMPPDPSGASNPDHAWSVSDDGALLAVALLQGERNKKARRVVKLFDVAARSEPGEIVPAGWPSSLAFSPDGRLLAITVSKIRKGRRTKPDVGVEIWDLAASKRKYQWTLARGDIPPALPVPRFIFGGGGPGAAVRFAPGGGVLATVAGYQLQLWTLTADGAKELTSPWRADGRHLGSRPIGFSADGSWVAAVDADEFGVVKIWDTRYGRLLAEARVGGHITDFWDTHGRLFAEARDGAYIADLTFTADGTHFATSTISGATPNAHVIRKLLLWEVPAELDAP